MATNLVHSHALSKLVFLLVIFLIPKSITSTSEISKIQHGSRAFFIFGDSNYDPGNNNYINTSTIDQANFFPYGETFFNYPTGRFSDGRLIADFIVGYAKLPLLPPFLRPDASQYYKYGANFASAGAGALVDTFRGSVINLMTQMSYFGELEKLLKHKLGDDEAKRTLTRGVYMFSIGSNDYMSLLFTNNSTMLETFFLQQYVDMVIGNLTIAIHDVYTKGGRKFGIMNLGSLGCLPGLRLRSLQNGTNSGCLEKASILAKLHNEALSKKLSQLSHQLKGFKYSLYDFNTTLTQLINHPSTYGFKEGKTACCGIGKYRGIFSCGGKRPPTKEFELCENPNDYVFWDSYHLTEKAFSFMANQIWAGGPSIVGPYNLSQFYRGP